MRAIIVMGNGVEEIEAVTIVDVLRRGGVDVVAVSIDEEFGLDIEGSHGICIVADEMWGDAHLDSADMLILPGGAHGEALRAHKGVLALVKEFDAQGKLIAALCAAPVVLNDAGILKGRTVVCYPAVEPLVTDAHILHDTPVVRDRNIITGAGPAASMSFALMLLETLAGTDKARDVADALLFKK